METRERNRVPSPREISLPTRIPLEIEFKLALERANAWRCPLNRLTGNVKLIGLRYARSCNDIIGGTNFPTEN